MTLIRLLAPASCFTLILALAPASATSQQDWYAKAVKTVEGRFEPAEAKPGQTVTFTLTVELNPGYHTYPIEQPDKNASSMTNIIKYPETGPVVFVGPTIDPKGYLTKAVPEIGVKELREYEGKVVYTRKAVIAPTAPAGAVPVKLAAFKLTVCDDNNCFPPKTVPVEATVKVLPGPALPVEPMYAAEVQKALEKK